MADIRHFTLSQLQQLLSDNDEIMANSYISQNLAIVRNVNTQVMKHQFEQGPMMMPEMRILVIKSGDVESMVNLRKLHLVAGDLVFLASGGIVHAPHVNENAFGIGLSMSDDLLALAVGSNMPKAFDGRQRDFLIHLSPSELHFLDDIHRLLYCHSLEEGHSAQVTLSLISTFLWYVDQLRNRKEVDMHKAMNHEQRVFEDFINLVVRDVAAHHRVEYYASQLCLSTRYFSTIVAKASGKTPKQWIDDTLLTRVKIELKHSSKPVAQIADEMSFPNVSFFCKFFKRLTGITPQQFRGR